MKAKNSLKINSKRINKIIKNINKSRKNSFCKNKLLIENNRKTTSINDKENNVKYIYVLKFLFLIFSFYSLIIFISSKKKFLNKDVKYNLKNIINETIIVDTNDNILKTKFKNEINFIQACLDDKFLEFVEKCENPKLSIVIPYYNSIKYINRLLRSIQRQELKELEIVFVDDNSNDSSYQLIEEYSKIDKRIRLVKNDNNKGCLYGYVRSILEAKSNYTMIIDADDMLLSNLKELYEISVKSGKDINDFGYLRGKFNDFYKIQMNDKELYQPDIGELIFSHKYHGSTFIAKKIMKTEVIKNIVKKLNDEYLNSNIVYHCDTFLFICIFYYVNTYQSYSHLFSQFHVENKNSSSTGRNKNYNEFFRVSLYLFQYISELPYSSKKIYNNHIQFAINPILEWSLNICGNRKLEVNFEKLNKIMDSIIKNKDLEEANKIKITKIINTIKQKSFGI